MPEGDPTESSGSLPADRHYDRGSTSCVGTKRQSSGLRGRRGARAHLVHSGALVPGVLVAAALREMLAGGCPALPTHYPALGRTTLRFQGSPVTQLASRRMARAADWGPPVPKRAGLGVRGERCGGCD